MAVLVVRPLLRFRARLTQAYTLTSVAFAELEPSRISAPVVLFGPGNAVPEVLGTAAETVLRGAPVVATTDAQRFGAASSDNEAHAGRVLGIAANSANADGPLRVQTSGVLAGLGYAWTVGEEVFAGPSGTLTQTAPENGFSQSVGVAVGPSTLFIDIREAVLMG